MTIYRPSHHLIIPGARVSQPGGAAGNGLLNALIAYWPGNEASGDALDLHTNALHLTNVNTVTSAAGLVYAAARQYTAANSEYHTRPSEALLRAGDIEFTLATWVYLDSKGVTANELISKWGVSNNYLLYYRASDDRFRFGVGNGAFAAVGAVSATSFGSPALATWHFVIGWHDPTANTANIQINNGTIDSVATTGPAGSGIVEFGIGGRIVPLGYQDGRIGPTMFWKSAAGGGGVLSAAQRTALYNAGAGLPYASFTA